MYIGFDLYLVANHEELEAPLLPPSSQYYFLKIYCKANQILANCVLELLLKGTSNFLLSEGKSISYPPARLAAAIIIPVI